MQDYANSCPSMIALSINPNNALSITKEPLKHALECATLDKILKSVSH